GEDAAGAYLDYRRATGKALRTLRAEAVPAGLASFQADVATALELQMAFFQKAVAARREGSSMQQVFAIPEGRTASARLQGAFRKMAARYPAWTPAMRDSV